MSVLDIGGSYKNGIIAGTNEALATQYEYLGMTLYEHFNIHTRTLTNSTVIIEGTLDDINWRDVTNNLFGSATLASNTEYQADTYMTYKDLRIAWTPTNAANATGLSWMIKKGGGR